MPITRVNMQVLSERMTEIETIDLGSMVMPIEDLLEKFFLLKDSAIAPTTIVNGQVAIDNEAIATGALIKANNVEFSDRVAASPQSIKLAQLRALRSELSQMIGLSFSTSGSLMVRSDRYSSTINNDRRFISQ
jgi:hypothetical protein